MRGETILALTSVRLKTQTGKQIIIQYTGMCVLREVNAMHTGGIKTKMFSEEAILLQDCFREKRNENVQMWEKLFQPEGMGGKKAKQCEQDELFQKQMWLKMSFFRKTSIIYFIPLESWTGRKVKEPTGISQSGSIIVQIEMDRR